MTKMINISNYGKKEFEDKGFNLILGNIAALHDEAAEQAALEAEVTAWEAKKAARAEAAAEAEAVVWEQAEAEAARIRKEKEELYGKLFRKLENKERRAKESFYRRLFIEAVRRDRATKRNEKESLRKVVAGKARTKATYEKNGVAVPNVMLFKGESYSSYKVTEFRKKIIVHTKRSMELANIFRKLSS